MNFVRSKYFEIGKAHTVICPSADGAGTIFARQRALLCGDTFEGKFLSLLTQGCQNARFVSSPVKHLGHRWIEKPPRVGAAIEIALNRTPLLNWLKSVTGNPEIGRAEGRLVETRAGGVDQLTWHDDQIEGATLGITVHLRDCAYDGGQFELRDKASKRILFGHQNPRAADLLIFDIGSDLEHRVLPIQSGNARLVFTGWFIKR